MLNIVTNKLNQFPKSRGVCKVLFTFLFALTLMLPKPMLYTTTALSLLNMTTRNLMAHTLSTPEVPMSDGTHALAALPLWCSTIRLGIAGQLLVAIGFMAAAI